MSLAGTVIVITGASSGIGREAARELAGMGAVLAVVGRNPERTRAVASEVGGRAYIADFDRLDDVRRLAANLIRDHPRIDVLANNAGGLVSKRALTVDGHERTLQSNHLAPFLLTRLLLPRLMESDGRVVSTASVAHRWAQLRFDDLDWQRRPWLGGWRAYGTSKLITILFIRELARRSGIEAFSFHPGFVATGFGADSPLMKIASLMSRGHYGISATAGAVPLVQLASIENPGAPSGSYFDTLTPESRMHRRAHDEAAAARLWNESSRMVGLDP